MKKGISNNFFSNVNFCSGKVCKTIRNTHICSPKKSIKQNCNISYNYPKLNTLLLSWQDVPTKHSLRDSSHEYKTWAFFYFKPNQTPTIDLLVELNEADVIVCCHPGLLPPFLLDKALYSNHTGKIYLECASDAYEESAKLARLNIFP